MMVYLEELSKRYNCIEVEGVFEMFLVFVLAVEANITAWKLNILLLLHNCIQIIFTVERTDY